MTLPSQSSSDHSAESNGNPSRGLLGDSAQLVLLRILTESQGLPFNKTRASRALRQAEIDIPPTAPRAARQRISLAAEAMGLQLVMRQLSVREAIAMAEPDHPLALFAISAEGKGRWFALVDHKGKRGRLARLWDTDKDEWLDAETIARWIDAADADVVVEWWIAQPAAPMSQAASLLHGEGHGGHDDHHHEHHISPQRRLIGLLWPERRDIWTVIAYSIGIGILSLATPIAVMTVVNTIALATLVQQLLILTIGLLVCLGLAAVLQLVQTVVVEFMQRRIFVRVAADLAYRLPRVQIEAFDRQHGPELVNRFFDVLTVQKAGATLLLDGVALILQMVIGLVLLAFYHQILLGFDLLLLLALVMIFLLGRGAVRAKIQESRAKYAVAGWMEELARHPAAFKLSGGPHFALERADELARDYVMARRRQFRILLRQIIFALGVYVVASAALLGLGGWLVVQGQLTLGQLVAAEMVVSLVVLGFAKVGKQLESFYDLLAGVDKLGHLVDLPLEREEGIHHHGKGSSADLRLVDLSFRYDGGQSQVLDQITLHVRPGERVGIAGPNGCGKSTLLELLVGLRQPTGGRIEIDNIDLRDLRLDSLRQHVSIVRGIEIFEGSVLDNLRLGRDEITIPEVRTALEEVGLLETIHLLPRGLNTHLGSGGRPLSLGQAERLVIARALLGQPRLLLLDELLDDMSPEAFEYVKPVLFSANPRWTLMVASHSPEILGLCDRVVRLSMPAPSGSTNMRETPAAVS
jgi:putative ABC transport system ATP-binding protein